MYDFRFQISETLRVLLYQCSTLKPGFNGRHNHFYSSSCLRLEHGVFFVRAHAIGEKELLAQVQCLCLYLHRLSSPAVVDATAREAWQTVHSAPATTIVAIELTSANRVADRGELRNKPGSSQDFRTSCR